MAIQAPFLLCLLALAALWTSTQGAKPTHYSIPFNRTSFPPGFIFGVGSAAYQTEGAAYMDGKGPSIWDTFTRKQSGKIEGGGSGDVAEDVYHRYKEDIQLLKRIGLDSFRFSISWSRLFPSKTFTRSGVNVQDSLSTHAISIGFDDSTLKSKRRLLWLEPNIFVIQKIKS